MFKEILNDSNEITNFIIETSPNRIDKELLFEYFFGCKAILKIVDIKTLKTEDENHHLQFNHKMKKYQKLVIETMPPLIVEDGKILDGNHRLRIAMSKGMKRIIIYDVIPL